MHILKRQKTIIVLSWIAVLLWLILIFSLSAQPATQSNGMSKKVTEIVIKKVGKLVPIDAESDTTADLVSKFNHFVRKFAHFFAYLILGLLVTNALRRSGMKSSKSFVLSLLFCIVYASSDELHQLFVPGRGGQIKDVFIDSAGAFVGIAVYGAASRLKRALNEKVL
ncbi:VanZ family protein [Brassicibacter mesophilus]|uniref:VanZ family protein n=1 Tax=Brassicibacter mesophilus TaxID=745119 RepID=UPI003D246322